MPKALLKLYLIGILFYATGAQASVRPVDISAKLGPPTNQGNIGNCWAHAIAVAYSVEVGQPVSPLSVNIQYMRQPNLDNTLFYLPWNGGEPQPAMAKLLRRTFCPLALEPYATDAGGENLSYIDALFVVFKSSSGIGAKLDEYTKQNLREASDNLLNGIGQYFPDLISPFKTMEEVAGEAIDKACNLRIRKPKLPKILVANRAFGTTENLRILVDQALNEGKPAVVSYLDDSLRSVRPSAWWAVLKTAHVSAIIGQKMGAGGLIYRLRNSWGNCTYPGSELPEPPPQVDSRCEYNGDTWVYAYEILPYTHQVMYFQDQK